MTPQEELSGLRRLAELEAKSGKSSLQWSDVPGKALENTPESLGNVAAGAAGAVAHPIDTSQALLDVANGALQKALPQGVNDFMHQVAPGTAGNEAKADAVGEFYKNRYGSEEGFKNALAKDPAGVMLDLSSVLTGGGAAAAKVPGLAKIGQQVGNVGRNIDPLVLALNAGKVALKPVGYAANLTKAAYKPFSGEAGQSEIISNLLNTAAGNESPMIQARLAKDATGVPGVQPTAAEMANNGGIAAVQRWAEQANPSDYAFMRQSNADARTAALRGIAGSDADLADAIAKRTADSNKLYTEAESRTSPVDDQLAQLLQSPVIQNAAKAAGIDRGRISPNILTPAGETLTSTITGAPVKNTVNIGDLHSIKLGLDDMKFNPSSALEAGQLAKIKGDKAALLQWLDNNSPEYAAAIRSHIENSQPINQMQVGKVLMDKANSALSNYGPMTRENAETFARALRDANRTAETATGYKGAKLNNIMTPDQMQQLGAVAKSLAAQANADTKGRGVGSNTFQNLSMNQLAESSGMPTWLRAGASNIPGSRLVSGIVKAAYEGADKKMHQRLSEILLDPKETARVMAIQANKMLPSAREYPIDPRIIANIINQAGASRQ